MLFRYGVAVLFNLNEANRRLSQGTQGTHRETLSPPRDEDTRVLVSARRGVSADGIGLAALTLPRCR